MKSDEEKGFSKKHPPERETNPDVLLEVQSRAKDQELPCAVAFDIAAKLGVPPEEVGFTTDRLEFHITKCQLGLYGYGPEKKHLTPPQSVAGDLEADIRSRLVNGRLPCLEAWRIADERSMGKMEVSSACETLGIKICNCQLGAFP